MRHAYQHYERLGAITKTAQRRSWDYEVEIDGNCWHIEVKGTTGDPVDVILTPNEVEHAKTHPYVALYVLSNINITAGPDGTPTAAGGQTTIFHPWRIEDGHLRPLGFKYRLPGADRP